MLVYANNLSIEGAGAEAAIFKGIGGWLKQLLGFGLRSDQLKNDGQFNGKRGSVSSTLRIRATTDGEPELYSWVLKHQDDLVYGRRWIVEIGLRGLGSSLILSCVLKTDERSTLVASPVTASQPRLIRYVVSNVRKASDADFAMTVPGVVVKTVGNDTDSYHGLLAEIERAEREWPVVLVSYMNDGTSLLNITELQHKLIGLAQVVEVSPDANSYEMVAVLGKQQSAWSGALNIVPGGSGRARYFLANEISEWGESQHERISRVLAWVTSSTNIAHLRRHVRPEGVMLLGQRRYMEAVRRKSQKMNEAELRQELTETSRRADEQSQFIDELIDENSQLEKTASEIKNDLEESQSRWQNDLAKKDFTIRSLQQNLTRAGGVQSSAVGSDDLNDRLLGLVCVNDPLSPFDCITLIKDTYSEKCIVLTSAKASARKMDRFVYGRSLLDLLRRLVTDYRSKLMKDGDNEAKKVFGKHEYAAKESKSVMSNKALRRRRTFEYGGHEVEMFRHLKIGVGDDLTKTIRVHFHWDASGKKIVIGYCGEHLPISRH